MGCCGPVARPNLPTQSDYKRSLQVHSQTGLFFNVYGFSFTFARSGFFSRFYFAFQYMVIYLHQL